MQIKRFEARTMSEALSRVKQELGPEAVILSAGSRKSAGGLFGRFKRAGVEVTAAGAGPNPPPGGVSGNGPRVTAPPESLRSGPQARVYPSDRSAYRTDRPRSPVNVKQHALYRRLLSQDVEDNFAWEITEALLAREAFQRDGGEAPLEGLARILKILGLTAKPLALDAGSPQRIALIGPSGVGKTTAAAKLAAVHALDPAKRVALLSLDNQRLAATDQLRAFAEIIGVDWVTAADPSSLSRALERFGRHDLVLVDTPGIGPRSREALSKLASQFQEIAALQVHLVLSAAGRVRDHVDLHDSLTGIRVSRLMFSKIDETLAYGGMLNTLLRLQIPVGCFFDGTAGPEGVIAPTVELLSGWLLGAERDEDNRSCNRSRAAGRPPAAVGENSASIENTYVANINSDVFHTRDCKWTRMIKAENVVTFRSLAEARGQNFKPCRTCCRPTRESAPAAPVRRLAAAVGR